MSKPRAKRTETCPNCGETFRAGRLACPECGSDVQTGWKDSEEVDYQSIDLPEAHDAPPRAALFPRWLFLTAAILALLGFVLVFVWR